MGLEISYQAIPDHCPLLEIESEELQFLGHYFSGVRTEEPFGSESGRMKKSHPGIETRIFSLDRDWDVLKYLLSKLGPLGQAAIKGSLKLERAKGVQGIPIGYSNSAQVREIQCWLQQLRPSDLSSQWDSATMEQDGLYKFFGDEELSPRYENRFLGLQRYYSQLVQHKEGLIVVTD
jgi:hypothetical protein